MPARINPGSRKADPLAGVPAVNDHISRAGRIPDWRRRGLLDQAPVRKRELDQRSAACGPGRSSGADSGMLDAPSRQQLPRAGCVAVDGRQHGRPLPSGRPIDMRPQQVSNLPTRLRSAFPCAPSTCETSISGGFGGIWRVDLSQY